MIEAAANEQERSVQSDMNLYMIIKRIFDIVISVSALIFLTPVFAVIAVLIYHEDHGKIFYTSNRVGLNGRIFRIYKFRSMKMDSEVKGAQLAKKEDDRITPVGKFIRRIHFDELPQIFNILKGDMSLVGPRPERPEIIAQYTEVMPEFAFRMKVKAGLAGFAQVYGKYNTSPYDKLKLDLTYIENYSVWLDLKLMLLTLKVLFWPDSTEGVESEQVTAFKAAYDGRAEKDDD